MLALCLGACLSSNPNWSGAADSSDATGDATTVPLPATTVPATTSGESTTEASGTSTGEPDEPCVVEFVDDFDDGLIDEAQWEIFGDDEHTMEVVDGRLRWELSPDVQATIGLQRAAPTLTSVRLSSVDVPPSDVTHTQVVLALPGFSAALFVVWRGDGVEVRWGANNATVAEWTLEEAPSVELRLADGVMTALASVDDEVWTPRATWVVGESTSGIVRVLGQTWTPGPGAHVVSVERVRVCTEE